MKLLNKIKKYLLKEELHRIEVLEIAYKEQIQWCQDRADDYYRQTRSAENYVKQAIELADDCRKTMNKI